MKADVLLEGRPLLEHVARAMDAAGLDVVVVTKEANRPTTSRRLLIEADEPVHPLAGILHALNVLGEPIVVCPCDMPLVPAGLLRHLTNAAGPDVLVTSLGGHVQPLVGRYSPAVRDQLAGAVHGSAPARRFIQSLGPAAGVADEAELTRHGDPSVFMRDVDTPEDLAWAREVARRRG